MDDFKYDVGSFEPEDVIFRVFKALRQNNALEALHYIEEHYQLREAQFHADNAIKAFKERLTNDK